MIARREGDGWTLVRQKAHMGKWYKVPVGAGAGVAGWTVWTRFRGRVSRICGRLPRPRLDGDR